MDVGENRDKIHIDSGWFHGVFFHQLVKIAFSVFVYGIDCFLWHFAVAYGFSINIAFFRKQVQVAINGGGTSLDPLGEAPFYFTGVSRPLHKKPRSIKCITDMGVPLY